MRIGMLTGGGDCPGLNAVIRAVVRKGEGIYGHELVGFRHGWRGVVEGEVDAAHHREHRGLDPPRRHDPRHVAHQPLTGRRRRRARARHARRGARRRARSPSVARTRSAWPPRLGVRTGVALGGGAEDDRQRPVGHRLHLRVPHRGAGRDRCDRPAAHHRREPRPGDGGRGDGPPRRVDRGVLRASPAAPTSSSFPSSRSTSPTCARGIEHRHRHGANFSIVVVAEGAAPVEGTITLQSGEVDEFGHVRLGGISNVHRGRDRGGGPASRPASRSSVTCCAAARRPRTTASSRHGSASPRSTRCTTATFGTMVALRGDRPSCACPSTTRCSELEDGRPRAARGRERLLRLTRRVASRGGGAATVLAATLTVRWARTSTTSSTCSTSSTLEVNLFRGVSPDDATRPACVRRPGAGAGARGRGPHRRARPAGALAARVLPASGRSRRCRSSTTSTASATAAASPPAGWSPSSTGRRSSTCGVVPDRRARPDHPTRCPTSPIPTTLPAILRAAVVPTTRRSRPRPVGRAAGRVERPIDLRVTCEARTGRRHRGARDPDQDMWLRADGAAARRPAPARCVVAYASDLTLLGTATLPHHVDRWPDGRGHDREPRPRDVVPPAVPRRRVAAVPRAQPVGGRAHAGFATGQVFRRDGTLAVTVAQEGLMRPVRLSA